MSHAVARSLGHTCLQLGFMDWGALCSMCFSLINKHEHKQTKPLMEEGDLHKFLKQMRLDPQLV